MTRQSLEDWMHEQCLYRDKGPCKAFALQHLAGGSVPEDVHVCQVPSKIEAGWVTQWAEVFVEKAKTYAQGIPGAQQFVVLSFHGDGQRHTTKYPMIEAGYTEIDGLATEGPSSKGLLQQMMRHTEACMSAVIRSRDIDIRHREQDARERQALRQENFQYFTLIKDLLAARDQRTHDHRLEEIRANQWADFRKELVKWAPNLLNTVTGREVVPESTADSQIVEGLIDALKDSGAQALPLLQQLKLPPYLQLAIAERFQRGMKTREQELATRTAVDDTEEVDGGLQ